MTTKQKEEITQISKEFASGFKPDIDQISGSGWLIVDPLSAYLKACGYNHTLGELPACDKHVQVLVMRFKDGSQFIPAGSDLKMIYSQATDWMWIR